jgi:hypothetical protein
MTTHQPPPAALRGLWETRSQSSEATRVKTGASAGTND